MNSNYEELRLTTAPGPAAGEALVSFAGGPLGRTALAVAGQPGTWTVVFTAGPGGIAPGGGVALWWDHQGFRFSKRSQQTRPLRRGYVTVEGGPSRIELRVNSHRPGHTSPLAAALVQDEPLAEGQQIVLRFNDTSQGAPAEGAWPNVLGMPLHVGVDADGSGTFRELAGSPLGVGTVADQRVDRYLVLAPSSAAPGEPHAVQIVALDQGGNLTPAANAELDLTAEGCEGLPEPCFLSPLEGGRLRIEGLTFAPGVQRIRLEDRERGIAATSNPVRCAPGSELRLFWGDLHNHCYDEALWLARNPFTDADYGYRFGRDVSRLDFCCLNFHLFLENGFDGQEEAWALVQEAAARHHEPGRYVTFTGMETHGFGGDRCIIFNGDRMPRVRLKELYGCNTRRPLESVADLADTFDWAAEMGAMITAHVGGTPTNLEYHDPRVEWSIEVASMHGNFEFLGQDALHRGMRVGFHGASDGHVQTPGQPRRPGFGGRNGDFNRRDTGYASGALMGVLARDLTRESLWEAFRARRTYATTGARIWLDFQVNGEPMGAEVALEGPPSIHARVIATAPIERLELIRDDRLLHTQRGDGLEAELDLRDESCPRGDHSYYLRVSQDDGEFAWSSPVWVTCAGGLKEADPALPAWNADDPEVTVALPPAEARRYEAQLREYLALEEDANRWEGIQAVRVVASPMGRYALLLAYDRKNEWRVHFKVFLDYADMVLRSDVGWRDFGQAHNSTARAFQDYLNGPVEMH